jgi:hypothetical protein
MFLGTKIRVSADTVFMKFLDSDGTVVQGFV